MANFGGISVDILNYPNSINSMQGTAITPFGIEDKLIVKLNFRSECIQKDMSKSFPVPGNCFTAAYNDMSQEINLVLRTFKVS
jgi:hypothetical protein